MRILQSFEATVTINNSKWHNIPTDLNLYVLHVANKVGMKTGIILLAKDTLTVSI
jgi:hypothetical protein